MEGFPEVIVKTEYTEELPHSEDHCIEEGFRPNHTLKEPVLLKGRYKCQDCSFSHNKKSGVANHRRFNHKVHRGNPGKSDFEFIDVDACEVGAGPEPAEDPLGGTAENPAYPFCCDVCGYRTELIDSFRIHAATHSQELITSCCPGAASDEPVHTLTLIELNGNYCVESGSICKEERDAADSEFENVLIKSESTVQTVASTEESAPNVAKLGNHSDKPDSSCKTRSRKRADADRGNGRGKSDSTNSNKILATKPLTFKTKLSRGRIMLYRFSCSDCSFIAITKRNMTRHIKLSHQDELLVDLRAEEMDASKPQDRQCSTCGWKTSSDEDFERHSTPGNYVCGLCDYVGSDGCDLRVHRKSHKGKLFACNGRLCGFVGLTAASLLVHKRFSACS